MDSFGLMWLSHIHAACALPLRIWQLLCDLRRTRVPVAASFGPRVFAHARGPSIRTTQRVIACFVTTWCNCNHHTPECPWDFDVA